MSKFFIRRPIVAIVIAIVTVVVGIVAMLSLPTAQFPDIVPPEIMVQATYPGADSKTLSQAVATPIEQQMNGVDNMLYMDSVSANNGQSTVYVDFDVKTNPDTDQVLSQLRLSQAQPQLPAEVNTAGVTVQKSLTSPLMIVGLSSATGQYDADFLTNYAIINLQDQLTRVKGVSRVQIFGGQYALRIWVRPDKLAQLGVTATDVINALSVQNNVNPAGQIGGEPMPLGQQFTYTVRTQGRLITPEEFGNIVLRANADGSILHLRDVARIELGEQIYSLAARYNGAPAGMMGIYQLPGSNAVETAKAVRAKLAELSKTFPAGLRYDIPLDTTKAVTAGINEIIVTLGIALVLVILVVFLFLQGWRATLIPLMAVPVSLIGTFILFPLLGFSINTLSLFGLVLAIGLVVDDAIIVVEAVEHHIEEGMDPKDATIKAMEEVGGPVVAIALILAAVFIPTAAIPGITGRLYQQFAVTIAISVMISAFNALTLSPALAALLLKPKNKEKRQGPLAKFFAAFNRFFHRTTENYAHTSGVLIHKSGITMLALAAIAVLAVFLGSRLPSGFIPQEDQGYMFVAMILPDAASLQRTDAAALKVSKALLNTPGIGGVVQVNGFSLLTQTQSTNTAFFFVSLKPWEERKSKQEQFAAIQGSLVQQLGANKDGLAFSFPPPAIPGVGTSGGVTMILEDRSGGDDPTYLTKNLMAYLGALSKHKEIAAAIPSYLPAVPQLYADVDKEKALAQQVDLNNVYATMSTFMGGYLVNYFNRFGRQWQTYVEAEGSSRTKIDNINQFYVRSANGSQVPLASLVHVKQITGPEFVMRFNEFNAAQLNITGAQGYSSGQVRAALEEAFHESMPQGMGFDYMGMSFQEQLADKGVPAWVVFALSLLFVFLILAALYESWSLPFSVLLSTPVAILGAYIALSMRSLENDIFATVGLIMLIGLSAKNAILIVEFAVQNYRAGHSIAEAALHAARLRFRPIVMTALAFIFGCLPLWTATGAGSVSRRILGTVVIGGMSLATVIGILMVPVTFSVVEYITHRLRHGGKGLTMDSHHDPEIGPGDEPPTQLEGRPRMKTRFPAAQFALAGSLASIFLAGCNVGPKYVRPQITAPAVYRGADDAAISSDAQGSLGDQQWSEVFHEPELQALIRTALANNLDLRIAAQRVLEASAQVRITRSQEFPQITIGGTGAGAGFSSGEFGSSISSPLAEGGLSASASWTPDFWGLYRKQTEAARDQMLAQAWAQRAVRMSLVEQVATTYIQLRALDRQLEIAQQAAKVRQDSVALTNKLEQGGDAPLSDVREAEQLLYTATAQIPALQQQIQQDENAMRLLLGQDPGPVAHTDPNALAPAPENLPTGLPSQLLERRPDIQQAEAQLMAANAQVGVARAQFFPQLSISASGGVGGESLSDIFSTSGGLAYGLGTLTQPIFEGGKLRGQLQLSKEQKEEMVLDYRKAILGAFRDVSNSLIAVNKQRATRQEQEKLTAAADDASRLARVRYQGGATSYLEVLTNDSNLLTAQLNLVTARQNEALSLVQLYSALGGGWQQP